MNVENVLLPFVIAVTVVALVEYGKTAICTWKTARTTVWLQLAAVLVSVVLCLLADADLYRALGITFAWRFAGCVLTGVFAARGANFLSDFVSKLCATTKTDM
jgi:hypothetical protein